MHTTEFFCFCFDYYRWAGFDLSSVESSLIVSSSFDEKLFAYFSINLISKSFSSPVNGGIVDSSASRASRSFMRDAYDAEWSRPIKSLASKFAKKEATDLAILTHANPTCRRPSFVYTEESAAQAWRWLLFRVNDSSRLDCASWVREAKR